MARQRTTIFEAESTVCDCPSLANEFGTKGDRRKEVSQAKAPDEVREYSSAFIVAQIST